MRPPRESVDELDALLLAAGVHAGPGLARKRRALALRLADRSPVVLGRLLGAADLEALDGAARARSVRNRPRWVGLLLESGEWQTLLPALLAAAAPAPVAALRPPPRDYLQDLARRRGVDEQVVVDEWRGELLLLQVTADRLPMVAAAALHGLDPETAAALADAACRRLHGLGLQQLHARRAARRARVRQRIAAWRQARGKAWP